jgi:hypothetical protein
MMVMAIGVDVVEDGGDKVQAVGIEHREHAVMALLKVAVRSEAMAEVFGLSLGLLVFAQDFAHDLGLVLLELIADFGL